MMVFLTWCCILTAGVGIAGAVVHLYQNDERGTLMYICVGILGLVPAMMLMPVVFTA